MDQLKRVPFFASLDDKLLQRLEAISYTKKYKHGEILFYQGDAVRYLTLLVSGELRLYKITSHDKEITIHTFSATAMIAEAALLQNREYPATAEFMSDATVILIDAKIFEEEFLNDSKVARAMIGSLSNKVRMLESVIEQSLVMDAEERVKMLINRSLDLLNSMKHYEIAQMLHLTPETLSRVLKRLLQEGVVKKHNGKWCI